MKIFALSDLHLALNTPGKEMDRFGAGWIDHARTIARSWRERVGDGDLVLVAGDISWAMKLEQARPDLDFLGALPGVKLIIRGNHDYWWSTKRKVRAALPPGIHALGGDAILLGGVAVAGTRLWDVPGVAFGGIIDWTPNPISAPIGAAAYTEDDLRIYRRELIRLDSALAELDRLTEGRAEVLKIVMTHYPPCGPDLAESEAMRRIAAHGARHVVFGHLHAVKTALAPAPFGWRDGIGYHLTSCDYLGFAPALIAELPGD